MADPGNFTPPDDRLPAASAVPKPDVALPAAPPYPAAPIGSGAAAPGVRASASPPPGAAAGTERDIATITTLQRRADELRTEEAHRGSDALAFVAAAGAAALAAAARATSGEVERARAPEAGSPADRRHDELDVRQDRATQAAIDASLTGAPSALVAEEVAGAALEEYDAARDLSDGSTGGDDRSAPPRDAIATGDDRGAGPGTDEPALPLDPMTMRELGLEPAKPERGAGPAEVGIPHDDAVPWNGQTSIGTISYVDGDRAEQYAGRGSWTSFSITKDLGGVTPEVGRSVQINGDGTVQATPEQQLAQSQSLQIDRGRALT